MPRKPAATKKPAVTKIFVLDTNVLMHDPSSLSALKSTMSSCPS